MTMQMLPDMKIPVPDWLDPSHRRRLAGKRITVGVSRGVRARLRTPKFVLPSDWNERHRMMPSAESYPGRWRRDFAPHAAWVMDLWALPWVRELWFCGPDQASKTNSMLGCLGWSIHQDPGNIFYTASSEDKTKEIVNDKLIGMLRESPQLARLLGKRSDDTGMSRVRMNNGVTIRVAWANSPASTASFSARYTFNDEVDKWSMVGTETSPIRRIKKRAKNFPLTHKHFFASTPAGKYIYKGTMACQQVWTHAARCPDCGALVVMDEEHIVIPPDASEESIKADPESVAYGCNACGSLWDEEKRLMAYRTGDKYCIKGEHVTKPVDVGVHLTGFVTPDMKMADIALTILQARAGDHAAQIDLAHGVKCINYVAELSDRKEDYILRLRDTRPEGMVPSEPVQIITLHADTQDNGFWYTVRAWGYGDTIPTWLLKAGFVETLSGLEAIMASDWHALNGTAYRISLGIIDSQGHRTAEVYEWCKQTGVLAAAGASGRKSRPVTRSVQDTYPGTNRPIPGGLELYSLDTHFFKDALARKLQVEPTDPGAWLLHCGHDVDHLALMEQNPKIQYPHNLDAYARHLCAEGRDERGLWQNPTRKANHLFDCEVYGLALIYYLRQLPEFRNARPLTEVEEAISDKAPSKQVTHKSRRW